MNIPLLYLTLIIMDALAFEELLLESFERREHRAIRRRRYTGDGKIDGHVWLIQAKLYCASIRPEHIRAFAALCSDRGSSRLFVHTGRTGGASREAVARHGVVEVIFGQRLLALITGAPPVIGGKML